MLGFVRVGVKLRPFSKRLVSFVLVFWRIDLLFKCRFYQLSSPGLRLRWYKRNHLIASFGSDWGFCHSYLGDGYLAVSLRDPVLDRTSMYFIFVELVA